MFASSDVQLKAEMLLNLARKRCFGGKHTALENMYRGIDQRRLGKEGLKRLKKLGDELMKQKFVIPKPTHYGVHVSLNPAKAREIKTMIKEHLGIEL